MYLSLPLVFDSCNNLIVHYLCHYNTQLQQGFWRRNTYNSVCRNVEKALQRGENIFYIQISWELADRRERKLLEKDIKQEFEAIKCFKVFQEKSVMQNTRFLWKTLNQSETTLKSLYFSKACSTSSQGHLIFLCFLWVF